MHDLKHLDGPMAGLDEFDELLSLENQWEEEGRQDGFKAGADLGTNEGRMLGLEKGRELGMELGYYAGCAQCWLAAHQRFTSTELGGKPSAGDEDGSGSVVSDSTSSAGTAEKKGFKLSARAEKNLEAMIALIQEVPVDRLQDAALTEYIDRIRGKFKAAVSHLGMVPCMSPATMSL